MIGADQTRHQEERGEFDTKQIRLIQSDRNLLRPHRVSRKLCLGTTSDEQKGHLGNQDRGQNHRPNPDAWAEPPTFDIDGFLPQIKHHDHKNKKDHDGPGINDDFERGDKRRAQNVKHDRDSEQRHDKVEERMNGIQARDRENRRQDSDDRCNVEDRFHEFSRAQGIRSWRSVGGASFSDWPLSFPPICTPATRQKL